LAGAGLVGCKAHQASTEAPTPEVQSADDDQLVAELRDYHRHHHRGGVTQFIAMSLDTLGTDDSRRVPVERLQSELDECMAPTRALENTLLLSVAEGVVAGAVTRAGAVNDSLAKLGTAAVEMRDCKPDALNRLHGLLSSAEREALTDKVQAQWEVWAEVNDEAEVQGKEPDGRLAELTREVSLTGDQVAAISTALHSSRAVAVNRFDRHASEEYLQAFATAFASELFDAKSVMPRADDQLVTHGARRMVSFYETVTPLLTTEQRGQLATQLRGHANHQSTLSVK
jgi:hypothetical protein